MDMRVGAAAFALLFPGLSSAPPGAQDIQVLAGTVTIETRGRTTAVQGKSADGKEGAFLFCIDHVAAPQDKVAFEGLARVVYRPKPAPDIPAGVVVSGPESIANTLTVVPEAARPLVFVGPKEQALLPPGTQVLANANTIDVRLVRRVDWAPPNGRRRGTDLEGCLAPGG